MKIKSPIGFLAFWSAFLASGSWIVPTSTGVAVPAGTVMAAVPVDSDGASVPPILVLTTSDNPDLIQELGLQMAEQEGLQAEQSEVVSVVVLPEVAEQLSAAVVVDGGVEGRNPVDGDGKPLPPPLKLPPKRSGEPRNWKPVKGTPSRPITWIPDSPIPSPGGGQPEGSWDDEHQHWDVDDGQGGRVRIKPDGTTVGDDHMPFPDLPLPDVFPGIDWGTASQYNCIAVVTVGVGALGIILIIIFQVCSGGAWG